MREGPADAEDPTAAAIAYERPSSEPEGASGMSRCSNETGRRRPSGLERGWRTQGRAGGSRLGQSAALARTSAWACPVRTTRSGGSRRSRVCALPLKGKQRCVLESRAASISATNLEEAREHLREYAAPICMEASNAPLPPLRTITHTIPLKDDNLIYPWRPCRCPDALRPAWVEKRDAYLKSGRWRMTSARNTCPMLLLKKPGSGVGGEPPRLRVTVDLRARNANTVKLMPDMDAILRRVAKKPYRSVIDGKDAYEHIRIVPEHVERTAMAAPDGNMVSLVLQQGDCNAVATYQSLMNFLFGAYISVFMDGYLDDIIIYSDTLEEHVNHCKIVIDILKRERLYLSATKVRFLCPEMKVLGRILDDDGIRMDPIRSIVY